MGHDQLFKDILRSFFQEFLELFYSEVEARLDFETLRFLDKEVFTSLPEGSSREVDVLAELETAKGNRELVLVHVEVEDQTEAHFREEDTLLCYGRSTRSRSSPSSFGWVGGIHKDGKTHTYWRVIRSVRPNRKVVQETRIWESWTARVGFVLGAWRGLSRVAGISSICLKTARHQRRR
jgi:hypothetical protein